MKKVIITLLLSLMITNMFSFAFQTEYNYQKRTFETFLNHSTYNSQQIEYKGIGYTTNHSNGLFNSTQYYQGTYTPVLSGSSGRPGQPRRVKGYTADGDSINPTGNAGNPNPMWLNGYDYYYWNGHWYRKDGNSWSEWRTLLDLGWALWDWRSGEPGINNPTQYYKNKPTPIGDNYIWFMVCLVSIYSLINWIKLKRSTN